MFRMWVVALAIFAALGGTASADVFDDNPAAVSLGPGNVQLFARGPDGRILHRSLSAGAWSTWAPVDGLDAGSGPAAVVFGQSVYLFARSATNGAVYQNLLQNGSWSGWVSLGGTATSNPAAATRKGNGAIDLFVRGVDNALWWRTLTPGSGWGSWTQVGGNLSSGPTAFGFSSLGSVDVAVRNASGGISQNYWYNGAWLAEWRNKGGGVTGAPAFASPATDILDLFVRASANDGLYHHRHEVDADGAWRLVDPTKLSSSPAGTSDANGHLFLFAKIGDALHYRSVTSASTMAQNWGAWSSLGPVALPAPPAPPPPPPPPPVTPVETLNPRLTWTYRASRRSTKLGSLRLSRIAAGATVKVTCSKGCSAKRWTTRPKKSTLSLKRFTRRSIKVGRSIRVEVSKPGAIASVKTLKMRRRKAPQLTSRCLPPGATRPQRCAT